MLQQTIHTEWQTHVKAGRQQATIVSKELLTKLLEVGRHKKRKIITSSKQQHINEGGETKPSNNKEQHS
jgi:hypothetical protein